MQKEQDVLGGAALQLECLTPTESAKTVKMLRTLKVAPEAAAHLDPAFLGSVQRRCH